MRRKKRKRRLWLRIPLAVIVLAVVLSTLLVAFVTPIYRITGGAMFPTLMKGDIVITYKRPEYEKGDVCVMKKDDKIITRRIIASGGDTVEMDLETGEVFVNGEPLEESYLAFADPGRTSAEYPVAVPEGMYFVMGDNRPQSVDSREVEFALVSPEDIDCAVVAKVYPLDNMSVFHLDRAWADAKKAIGIN